MGDYVAFQAVLESEITSVNCQNYTINLNYSAQYCADYARIFVCQNASTSGRWFPLYNQCDQIYDLPLSGTRSLSVKEYRKDIMYAVVVGAGGRDSSNCPSYMINNFFNFSNCWMNCTIPGQSMMANRKVVPFKKSSFRSSNENLSSFVSEPSNTMPAVIALSSILAFCLILIAVIIYWMRMKRNHFATPNDQIEMDKLVSQIPESENQEAPLVETTTHDQIVVYIVFVDDCSFHNKVVVAFANYLQEDLGFKVIFELWETQKALENYSTWMQNSMESADKIIVVWSNGALERVQRFRENKCRYPDTFSPVVQHMQNSLFKYRDVSKYCLIYFSYSDDSIPLEIFNRNEFRHFELMREFENLYFNLRSLEKHLPGQILQHPKADIQTLFEPEVTKYGPILKNAIEDAKKQTQLKSNKKGRTDNKKEKTGKITETTYNP